MPTTKIPQASISRLSIYLRSLKELSHRGIKTISSHKLAKYLGISSDKLRKDLSYFGQFGKRGVGYDVEELNGSIAQILGMDRQWNIAICGAGNLGSALYR